jgi:hypothetical protein
VKKNKLAGARFDDDDFREADSGLGDAYFEATMPEHIKEAIRKRRSTKADQIEIAPVSPPEACD